MELSAALHDKRTSIDLGPSALNRALPQSHSQLLLYLLHYQKTHFSCVRPPSSGICPHTPCSTNFSLYCSFLQLHTLAVVSTCTRLLFTRQPVYSYFSTSLSDPSSHFSRTRARTLHILKFRNFHKTHSFSSASKKIRERVIYDTHCTAFPTLLPHHTTPVPSKHECTHSFCVTELTYRRPVYFYETRLQFFPKKLNFKLFQTARGHVHK